MKNYIYHDNGYGTTYKFEIVEKIPAGFGVWNIPVDAIGDYIPLMENASGYNVNINTLKAVKVGADAVKILNSAACCGVRTLKDAEKAISATRRGRMTDHKRECAKRAIDILRKIS